MDSSTHGTVQRSIEKKMDDISNENDRHTVRKIKYLWSRLFPDELYYKIAYPFFYKHKYLIPFLQIFRLFKAIFVNTGRLLSELKTVIKMKKH